MTNDKLKSIIEYYTYGDEDIVDKIVVLEGDEFADGCIGITHDYHLVYDYGKLAQSIAEKNNISIEEAIEFIDYNTIRSLPYINNQGLLEPIIMYSFVEEGLIDAED